MDPSDFTAATPGEVVSIGGLGHAFVPAPLPPDWAFPARLWPLLGEVKERIGVLEGLGRRLPNPAILLRPLRTREAVLSSRLEGTVTTARDVLLFELEGGPERPDPTETEARNDQREVTNYAAALRAGMESDLPLSAFLIRQMHGTLMAGVRGSDRFPGKWRTVQVSIGGLRFVPPPPERVPECLEAFDAYLRQEARPYDPLVDAFLCHYHFEAVHPFEDGNGRVGRLLLALCVARWGRLSKPWLYMSAFFERNRRAYMDRLYAISVAGDWDGWIEFCLTGAAETAADTVLRCDRLLDLQDELAAKLVAVGGNARQLELVRGLFENPVVRVKDLPARLGITYPTARADCDRLVNAGILEDLPELKPRTLVCRPVFDLGYDEDGGPGMAAEALVTAA